MVDPEVIAERLKLLVGYVADLEDEQGTDWERFVGDKKLRRYVERTLQLASERMAGFRNVLVHEYARIDPAIVFAALKRRVPDLRRFASAIAPLAIAHEPPGSTPPETPDG